MSTMARLLGGAVCGGTLMSLLQACEEDIVKYAIESGAAIEINLDDEPELRAVGGAVKKNFLEMNGGRSIVIVRIAEASFLVVSAICTHQGCEVGLPDTPGADFKCPCHGARFSSQSGQVTNGPVELPLQVFPYSFDASANVLSLGATDPGPKAPRNKVVLWLADEPALQNVGGAVKKRFMPYNNSRDVMIVRTGAESFLIASAVCPHNQCDVNLPVTPGANFKCPCHGAEYSSQDGSWQPSPQTASDLATFEYTFEADTQELTIYL